MKTRVNGKGFFSVLILLAFMVLTVHIVGAVTDNIGVFSNGTFYLDYPGTGSWIGCGETGKTSMDACMSWGTSGSSLVEGDWNGDGRTKIGIYSNGVFYLDYPGTGVWVGCGAPADPTKDECISWGATGDVPVVGDWSGNGKAKVGVFRNGEWYLDYPGTGTWAGCGAPSNTTMDECVNWGATGDVPVVGDWSGNGKIKIGVFRDGEWYLDYPGTGTWAGCGAPSNTTMDE